MALKRDSSKKYRKERNKRHVNTPQEFEERERELLKMTTRGTDTDIKGHVRIIAGKVKGFQLEIPPRARPVTDRMKTQIFDLIREDIIGRTVLDLYAGSGSFGLEAISRGAESATLVDASKHVEKTLLNNVKKVGFLTEATVEKAKAEEFLNECISDKHMFEIVFMDPPYKIYGKKHTHKVRELLNKAKQVLPGYHDYDTDLYKGVIIIKHPVRYELKQALPQELDIAETHSFGRNSISILYVLDPQTRTEAMPSELSDA